MKNLAWYELNSILELVAGFMNYALAANDGFNAQYDGDYFVTYVSEQIIPGLFDFPGDDLRVLSQDQRAAINDLWIVLSMEFYDQFSSDSD